MFDQPVLIGHRQGSPIQGLLDLVSGGTVYRTLLLILGVYYLTTGIFGAVSSSMWLPNTFNFVVSPGSAQMLASGIGFIGLLMVACSTIVESRARVLVCFTLIGGHLWNLSAHVFNYVNGYESNLAVTTL
ncbi:MAG: hypothetical protein O7E57_09560, partial [Gammaproteobacteria bacterium]|nr:hypothetical protein [Gammaproteobacteria bacterium]